MAVYKNIEKQIGYNIRLLREKAELTQEQVSARLQTEGCDIPRSAPAKSEAGQRHSYPDETILLKQIPIVTHDEIFKIKENSR